MAEFLSFPAVLRSIAQLSSLVPARRRTSLSNLPPSGWVGRARVALLTIIDEEFSAARKVFDLHENIAGTGYFAAEQSENRQWDVVLMRAADRSNVPVMGDVSALMEDLRPQVIILLGIAGGFSIGGCGREGIQLGDVVIADQVSYVEFIKIQPDGPLMRSYAIDHPSVPLRKSICAPIKETFIIQEHLRGIQEHLRGKELPGPGPFKIHIGGIVSGEKVFGDVHSEVQQALLKPFDKPLVVDMESIGIARAVCEGRSSFWYHPRYLVIRGISDFIAAPENNEMRAKWKEFAAYTAALVAREFVNRLPIDDGVR